MGRRELSHITQISNITQASTLSDESQVKVPRRSSNKKYESAASGGDTEAKVVAL